MILPLSCHGTFPRALALIEWKLNLLTFFSACYSSVHGATVHTFCPNSDFQYLLEQTGSCFSLTSVLRFLSHSECIMLHLESSCCVYWPRVYCGKGFTTLAVAFLYFFFPPLICWFFRTCCVALCGVFAVLSVDEANVNVENKLFFFFPLFAAYCWGNDVVATFQLSR